MMNSLGKSFPSRFNDFPIVDASHGIEIDASLAPVVSRKRHRLRATISTQLLLDIVERIRSPRGLVGFQLTQSFVSVMSPNKRFSPWCVPSFVRSLEQNPHNTGRFTEENNKPLEEIVRLLLLSNILSYSSCCIGE